MQTRWRSHIHRAWMSYQPAQLDSPDSKKETSGLSLNTSYEFFFFFINKTKIIKYSVQKSLYLPDRLIILHTQITFIWKYTCTIRIWSSHFFYHQILHFLGEKNVKKKKRVHNIFDTKFRIFDTEFKIFETHLLYHQKIQLKIRLNFFTLHWALLD